MTPETVAPATYGRSAFKVGEPLPGVLYNADLAAILDVSQPRISAIQSRGELAFLEMRPRVGGRARYSGRKVQQWLDGELTAEGAAPRRYFASAHR